MVAPLVGGTAEYERDISGRWYSGRSGIWGICSCEVASLDDGLGRRAAFAAINALQSRSVLGSRGESPGVRGEGELGLEPSTEPALDAGELVLLCSRGKSELRRGECPGRPCGIVPGDGPRELA